MMACYKRMGKSFDFRKKNFRRPFFAPSRGVKPPKIAPFCQKMSKKCQKVDSAPKNGPNLMYDSLFEAYGHVVWFSDKNFFALQFDSTD